MSGRSFDADLPWVEDKMKRLARISLITLLSVVWQTNTLGTTAAAQGPVVRALLFFSPTCPHCHKVINEDLPVIFRRFGGEPRVSFDQELPRDQVAHYLVSNGKVEILLVDASTAAGYPLYVASQEALNIPEDRRGVPRLVVRDQVLVGSLEIPSTFPGIIENGLASGGIDWPDVPGLDRALAAFPGLQPLAAAEESDDQATGEPAPASGTEREAEVDERPAEEPPPSASDARAEAAETPATAVEPNRESETEPGSGAEASPEPGAPSAAVEAPAAEDSAAAAQPVAGEADLGMIATRRPGMIELYQRDPVGNSFSLLVMVGMLVSLFAVYSMSQQGAGAGSELGLTIPVLSLLGIVVAAYLAYIESTGAEAVCGPVGDCNTVNQSEYAVLFGVLPVGVLGLVGYAAIVAAWLTARRAHRPVSDWAKIVLLGMTLVGTLFSVYLTFLEPFVIGATCAWCLTSAIVMTLLMLLTARPALGALDRLRAT